MLNTLDHPKTVQSNLVMPTVEKHKPGLLPRTEMTEIIVSPGELVQVLNSVEEEGSIPYCYFTFESQPAPRITWIDCQVPCFEVDTNSCESVGNAVNSWMLSVKGFSTSNILEVSGLDEIAHQSLVNLSTNAQLRLQVLSALLGGDEVIVFDSPWAEDGIDFFLLDLLRFLRQNFRDSSILPTFVVRDCGNLPAISLLANRILEIKDNGLVVEVALDYCGV